MTNETLWYPPGTDGWIEHKGGRCPIDSKTLCQILCRGERDEKSYNPIKAMTAEGWGKWPWRFDDSENDIVAYRIVEAAP